MEILHNVTSLLYLLMEIVHNVEKKMPMKFNYIQSHEIIQIPKFIRDPQFYVKVGL